jgi:hypothetical protein
MSFFIPFILLLFPFIILKIQGVPITFEIYVDTLKSIARHHFIGKALMNFENISVESMLYFIITFALYVLQMYQNTVQCIRFYRNTQTMNDDLCDLKLYVDDSIEKMKRFLKYNKMRESYKEFCRDISIHCQILEKIREELSEIYPFQCSIYKVTDIGYMMKCYYELHVNVDYEFSLLYSMGFDGYLQQMNGLYQNIEQKTMNFSQFYVAPSEPRRQPQEKQKQTTENIIEVDLSSCVVVVDPAETRENEESDSLEEEEELPEETYIRNQYYPPHSLEKNCVKNDAILDKHLIITGPNASGKTTFLKTTTLNILFSQQFGAGFYDSCCILPYTHFHSYLNIPDTSGRDSLFQAESRRCKEILDIIELYPDSKNYRHFCIFDELYSGTNPIEATKSAYAFLKYLSETYSHVDFLLTTHYVSICDKWEKSKLIQNYKMDIFYDDNHKMIHTYKIKKGISKIQGAISILEEMAYPTEIISMIRENE